MRARHQPALRIEDLGVEAGVAQTEIPCPCTTTSRAVRPVEVYERHRLWSADGTWEYLLQQIQAAADADGEVDWDISVDSTTVRAHQHAAGARIAPPAPVPKGRRQRTDGRSNPAELVRPPGGGGAGAEGLGRSRGGFTAKIHLSGHGRCRPLSLLINEGQRADCTQFEAVLDKIRVPRPVGRPRRNPGSVAADEAYSNSLIRRYLRRRGISHTIPEKSDSQARPPAQRIAQRAATGLRRRALQEAQHRRTGDQQAQAVSRGRHPLRRALLHLPRHDDGCRAGHLAALLNKPSGR
jgi:DDE family transposase